jgi:hypothetical protein
LTSLWIGVLGLSYLAIGAIIAGLITGSHEMSDAKGFKLLTILFWPLAPLGYFFVSIIWLTENVEDMVDNYKRGQRRTS